MKRRNILPTLSVIVFVLLTSRLFLLMQITADARDAKQARQEVVKSVIDARLETSDGGSLFDEEGRVSILLIGLDARSGSEVAHCDLIQFFEIDTKETSVHLTAVPRGTYASLPGTGHLPSDYYVSNACGIGGLDYGIEQIEKILGQQADYVVMVGFSEALGVFRLLQLPATETLQWLRVRQPYAIGEPQRAHNHSVFLKQLLLHKTLTESSRLPTALEYVLYRFADTDLTFDEAQSLATTLIDFDLSHHPERIRLSMKPEYFVKDIPYDVETLSGSLLTSFNPTDGPSKEQVQQEVIDTVNAGLQDAMFVESAFRQHLWLQLNDNTVRESVHFALLSAYLFQVQDEEKRQALLADYVIEMDALQEMEWAEQGRRLLNQEHLQASL